MFIELFAGLHGWGEGAVKEGYFVVGFDIVDMCKEIGVARPEGCNLVLQDVTTLHGSQFKDAAVIVASPPCQKYSYMAMPWSQAKKMADIIRKHHREDELNALFDASFRIHREACEAAGRSIPLIVENVRGAQEWVGDAQAHYGSFYLWGSVGQVGKRIVAVNGRLRDVGIRPHNAIKVPGQNWSKFGETGEVSPHWRMEGLKVIPHSPTGHWTNPEENGIKQDGDWFGKNCETSMSRMYSSKSKKRKAASAMIAKIPFPLSRHIARCFLPPPAGMEEGT